MIPTAYALRDFYKTLGGRIVRRLVREQVQVMWPDLSGLRVLGGGYALPYLNQYKDTAERTVAVMFPGLGIHRWPEDGGNLTCLADEGELPFETNSVDRIILVHALEFTGFVQPVFEEFWRILKSNGRIMIIVPNRIGLWARADWTPFGRGMPCSASQVEDFLHHTLFIPERTERALFIPPFKRQSLLRSAGLWEWLGRKLCPAMGGLVFIEASKQIYANTGKTSRVKAHPASLPLPDTAEPSKA